MKACLGIDSQTTYLGVALVSIEDERPLWADTIPLRGPGRTLGGHMRAAMRRVQAEEERHGATITRVAIERGVVHKTSQDTVWDLGGAYHLALDAVLLRFKDRPLALLPFRPAQWKMAALGKGKGNAGKDQIAVWARGIAVEAGWADWQLNGLRLEHATDAFGIAVAGVREGIPA